ncbi:MAG: hypothetical protein LQ343_003401 [Gyalolechia ehrenbergii]|nr:MAG: hypothetical protein LQ343_003401 [Gyalolechia ehrenbergii]
MDPAPPAWLRSYKAHSSIIPNYASKVRAETDDSATAQVPVKETPSNIENEKASKHEDGADPVTNPFTFPSTISLTLHNAGSLDTSYTNLTSTPSPSKSTFGRRYEDNPIAGDDVSTPAGKLSNQRRGPFCRFLAAIRVLLRSRTQNTLAY